MPHASRDVASREQFRGVADTTFCADVQPQVFLAQLDRFIVEHDGLLLSGLRSRVMDSRDGSDISRVVRVSADTPPDGSVGTQASVASETRFEPDDRDGQGLRRASDIKDDPAGNAEPRADLYTAESWDAWTRALVLGAGDSAQEIIALFHATPLDDDRVEVLIIGSGAIAEFLTAVVVSVNHALARAVPNGSHRQARDSADDAFVAPDLEKSKSAVQDPMVAGAM